MDLYRRRFTMDISRFTALANMYSEAASKVIESQNQLKASVESNGEKWVGEKREKFDQKYQEIQLAYSNYAQELMNTSAALRSAAIQIEKIYNELVHGK
ncbi:WXG100 family type VII secretion target [Bacillus sp. AFS098217]|nr:MULTISPECIES: WXG100 family type VII secretion target [unclassified Bacillus (in: firmicutes)]PEB48615.1 WXG100 family type VII secretion target [Bacillus sp. AFS098217]PEU15574.1 WXG100 family type VII secretion target [Bacillus sp. AFS014408]PEU16384.1 WXG100 family type VII secretion target [Bacillus sp. AFS019443]PFW65143.1 WXG100 family type VII secretion target [Bacillus sp. AFS075034]